MDLFAVMPTGATITLDVDCHTTVDAVKARIQHKQGIPPGQQSLIFSGTHLENGCTLRDYNVQRGSTLHVMLRGGLSGGVIDFYHYFHFEADDLDGDASYWQYRRERHPTRLALASGHPGLMDEDGNDRLVNFRSHWSPWRWSGWQGNWWMDVSGNIIAKFRYKRGLQEVTHTFAPLYGNPTAFWMRDRNGCIRRQIIMSTFCEDTDSGALHLSLMVYQAMPVQRPPSYVGALVCVADPANPSHMTAVPSGSQLSAPPLPSQFAAPLEECEDDMDELL